MALTEHYPRLAHLSETSRKTLSPEPIRALVMTSTAIDNLGQADLRQRRETLKHLVFWLFPTGVRTRVTYQGISIQYADQNPDLVIEVLGRGRNPTDLRFCSVQLRLTAAGYVSVVYGVDHDGQWKKAAHHAAQSSRQWMVEHYEHLIANRR